MTAWHDSSASSHMLLTCHFRKNFLVNFSRASCKCTDLQLSLSFRQLNTKLNVIKSLKIQGTKLKQLQHFLPWNKPTLKHSCKSQLYKIYYGKQ